MVLWKCGCGSTMAQWFRGAWEGDAWCLLSLTHGLALRGVCSGKGIVVVS